MPVKLQKTIRYCFMRERIKDKMRNFLVHEYFQVDSEVVFSVIHNEIPELQSHVSQYLAETDWEAWENQID